MSEASKTEYGYKKTRIGWIPEDWNAIKIGKILNIKSGYGFKLNEYSESGLPLIRIDNIGYGKILWKSLAYLPFNYSEHYSDLVLEKGDILIALNRPVTNGKLKIAKLTEKDAPAILYQRVGKLVFTSSKISKEYIFQCFQRYVYFYVIKKSIGSDQPFISTVELKKEPIPLPPLPEQKKIAEILSTWDNAIEKLEKLIEMKEQRKKGLMQQLLTGKKRIPGFGKPVEKVGEVPEGWYEVALDKLLKQVERRISFDDEKYYQLVSLRRRSGGLFHRETLRGKEILTKQLKKIKENDFLISKMQILHGALSKVDSEFEGMYVSNSYIILNTIRDKLEIGYFDYLSRTRYIYHAAYVSSYGVHIEKMTFNLNLFLKTPVIIPRTIEEQKSIVKIIEVSEQEIRKSRQILDRLHRYKKGLMQKLLTGEVRVQTEQHEPVDVS